MTQTSDIRWMVINPNDRKQQRRVPEWVRTAAMAADGTVYAAAALAGSEFIALLGQCCLLNGDHVYLPVRWMAKEFPEIADICERIERTTREHFAANARCSTEAIQ